MEQEGIVDQLRIQLNDIVSMDVVKQKRAILQIYDRQCLFQSPYIILSGRDEIMKSYESLITNNMDLSLSLSSVTYDQSLQTCLVDVKQLIRPKALGGVVSISMHFIIKAQLEESEDGLFRIVDHQEIHVTQDLISQMPIIGRWYDSGLRNAVGQISLIGTTILQSSGFLDFAPLAVDATKNSAASLKARVGGIASSTIDLSSSILAATGVQSAVSNLTGLVKWGAASLSEYGNKIDCYSSTCMPGTLCYSPSCSRNKSFSLLSTQSIHDVIRGAYSATTSQIGIFKNTSSL